MDFVLWESKAGNNFSQNVSFPYLGSAGTIKMDNSRGDFLRKGRNKKNDEKSEYYSIKSFDL